MMGREHWVEAPLSQLLESLESGSRPKGGVKGITEGLPSIGAEHLASDGGFNFENIRYIPEDFANSMKRGVIQPLDILVVKDGATTGKTSFVRENFPFPESRINEHVFICRAFKVTSKEFLFHYLKSHEGQEQIMSTFHGAAQGGISSGFADVVIVPLPPLPEQKRIVKKLDAILPKVKNAKSRLKKIPRILKRFRQSVLAAACSGRLTEDWRNLTIADSYIENCDIPESWIISKLPDVLSEKPRNGYSGKPVKYETKLKVLTLTATTSGFFKEDCYKYLDETISRDSPFWLAINDILIQRGNTIEYVGVPAIYKGKDGRYIFPDLMIRLRTNQKVTPDFLYYFLSWEKTRNYMRDNASGTAGSMPKINQRVLEEMDIFVPPIQEQHEIVRRVEKLFKLADSLEAKYNKVIERVEKIEQSVLAKAFRGKLASQDPNDEPAEELLKRILAEKAKLEAVKKKSKRFSPQRNRHRGRQGQ